MATLKNTTVSSTSSISIGSGTTAGRPTATTGTLRNNNSYSPGVLEFFDGTTWRPVTGYSSGTVGTGGQSIYYTATGIVHEFTTVGAHTFTPAFTGTVQVLVVAGGGGGAGSHGGGGGGGGVIYNGAVPVTSGTGIAVTVGGGGVTRPYSTFANDGGNSVFGGITANGGGGGGVWNQGTSDSKPGGSGGGGGSADQDSNRFRVWGGQGINGQGFPGGSGLRYNRESDNAHASGGGGGAGGPGHHSMDTNNDGIAANGGPGAASNIVGEVLYWGGGGGAGPHLSPGGAGNGGIGVQWVNGTYYAGGGGGWGYQSPTDDAPSYSNTPYTQSLGLGGLGGGGGAHHGSPQMPGNFPRLLGRGGGQAKNTGQPGISQTTGGNAGANTGGGGGGGNNGNDGSAHQNAGSGIVIVRY